MQEYEKQTCIHWVPKDDSDINYIYILPELGCYSMVGRTGLIYFFTIKDPQNSSKVQTFRTKKRNGFSPEDKPIKLTRTEIAFFNGSLKINQLGIKIDDYKKKTKIK